MNVVLAILGLLGGLFVSSNGGSSTGNTSTTAGIDDGGSADPDTPIISTPDPSPSADHGGHGDHGDHGGHMPPATDGSFTDITAYGSFHHSSSHTMDHSLTGGRTPITTEALDAYNGVRAFFGLNAVNLETIGRWAFDNDLTNNDMAYGQDNLGVGLYYGMQGAKVGWITDDSYDPQLLADIQRTARLGTEDDVMQMVQANGHPGFAEFLVNSGLVDSFISTLKMEPHYGGWMHGRTHGDLVFTDDKGAAVATAHDLNHLTVLSHDQSQPFMNDTFDWPQWPALDAPAEDVIDYYQSMVVLGDPHGEGIADIVHTSSVQNAMVMDGESLIAMLSTASIQDAQTPESSEYETPEVFELV